MAGIAKRLVLNPPDSAWGRRMLAIRGGKARQRQAKLETYPGGLTLQEHATSIRMGKQAAIRRARQPGVNRAAILETW